MTPDSLASLAASLRTQAADVAAMFDSNANDVLLQRPLPEKWSVAEHTEHLTMVNNLYLASIKSALSLARNKGWLGEGPYRRRWLAEKLIQSVEPPPKRRLPAFRKTVPPPKLDCTNALARFDEAQTGTVAALEGAKGVDLGRAQIRSPLFPLLKLSVMQGFRLIEAHNRRHMWHMEQALKTLEA